LEHEVAELVRAAARRDARGARAFVELIRRFEPSVLAVALAICGRGDEAGEIAQEAFLRAWKHLAGLKQPERFAAWIMEIARNAALDLLRQRPRSAVEPGPEIVDHGVAEPAEKIEAIERKQRLRAALAELDDLSRQIVMLRYFQDLSSREIGQMLDLSPAAVDMRLSRARQMLRVRLAHAEERRV
jgi:RNA polymerase sigma-70 factor (ECF subfamily)